jgi:hypothetical protein
LKAIAAKLGIYRPGRGYQERSLDDDAPTQ